MVLFFSFRIQVPIFFNIRSDAEENDPSIWPQDLVFFESASRDKQTCLGLLIVLENE